MNSSYTICSFQRAPKPSLKAFACALTSAHFFFSLISSLSLANLYFCLMSTSLFLSHISSAFYFRCSIFGFRIHSIYFGASVISAERAQLGSGHGMTLLPTPIPPYPPRWQPLITRLAVSEYQLSLVYILINYGW